MAIKFLCPGMMVDYFVSFVCFLLLRQGVPGWLQTPCVGKADLRLVILWPPNPGITVWTTALSSSLAHKPQRSRGMSTLLFTQWHERYGGSCLSSQGRTWAPLVSIGIAFCLFLKSHCAFPNPPHFCLLPFTQVWRYQRTSGLHSLRPLSYDAALTLRHLFLSSWPPVCSGLASPAFFITMDLPEVLGSILFSCLVTLHCQWIGLSRGIAHHFISCSTKHGCLIAVIIKFKFHSMIVTVIIWNQ